MNYNGMVKFMTPEEKINKFSNTEIDDIIHEYKKNINSHVIHFIINEKPIPYARARLGRSGIFYNPKASIENKYRRIFSQELSVEDNQLLTKLLTSSTAKYHVEIKGRFYVSIPQADSAKTTLLKEKGIIRPELRNGDIDNYMKLILDALHKVLYNDDKIVMSIHAEKFYSINPRSEIDVTLYIENF